jgi:hypothetical protein
MDVISTNPPPDSSFSGNAEWSLVNVSARHLSFLEEGEYRAEVHYIFQLRRRAIFYIAVLVIPIYLVKKEFSFNNRFLDIFAFNIGHIHTFK